MYSHKFNLVAQGLERRESCSFVTQSPRNTMKIVFVSIMMITSWLLPIGGIFVVDSTALKVVFGIFLAVNLFVGGSASGAQRMATEGSLTGDQWMLWESANVIVKIVISVASIVMIMMQ